MKASPTYTIFEDVFFRWVLTAPLPYFPSFQFQNLEGYLIILNSKRANNFSFFSHNQHTRKRNLNSSSLNLKCNLCSGGFINMTTMPFFSIKIFNYFTRVDLHASAVAAWKGWCINNKSYLKKCLGIYSVKLSKLTFINYT